jgi:hypothetical protein
LVAGAGEEPDAEPEEEAEDADDPEEDSDELDPEEPDESEEPALELADEDDFGLALAADRESVR